jgi:hypothetical protein
VRLAEFYCSPGEAQTYVRSILPARYLTGYALPIWHHPSQRDYVAPTSVWEHPGEAHASGFLASKEYGQRVYVDVDDNYADPDLFDGYPAEKAEIHRDLVRQADGVITASANLAEYYQEFNPNTHHIPNSVDTAEWEFPQVEMRTLYVGWGAGTTHDADASLIEPAMRWVSEQKGCKPVVLGVDPKWDFSYLHYPWMPLEAYRRMLQTIAIGLAPLLEDSSLNYYRSDLKFLDYTMAGALTIASDKPAYNQSIIPGSTGLLARTPEDFTAAVQEAVRDVEMRSEILIQARTHCMLRRHAAGHRNDYLRALGFAAARVPETVAA